MDWLVFDLVIFSIINDYDGVVVVLDGFGGVKEWFEVRIMGKNRRKRKQWGLKMAENRGEFEIKLVMIGPLKNYVIWWVDMSVC